MSSIAVYGVAGDSQVNQTFAEVGSVLGAEGWGNAGGVGVGSSDVNQISLTMSIQGLLAFGLASRPFIAETGLPMTMILA
jgi:hypothetical protein